MGVDMYSYSRVSTFDACPYQYKCRYLDGLRPITDNVPNDARIIGTAMHEAIEGNPEWRDNYLANLCISSDDAENEILKIEMLSEKVRAWLAENFVAFEFERKIESARGFIGFVDCLATDDNGKRTLIDFKYSNSMYYLNSAQVHVYKWILENVYHEKVDGLGYLLIPKIQIRKKQTETINQFRIRLREELDAANPEFHAVEYDKQLPRDFMKMLRAMKHADSFEKNETKLCEYCDYKTLCHTGVDEMLIPKNEKVPITTDSLKKIWLYGAPFSGKTYLANRFPDALLINSDGNTKYVDSPRIHICDRVEMNGRIEKRTLAWAVFKEVIGELETGEGKDYKTIVVDLLDDMYEFCRLYMYDKMKITHESDDNYKAWDKVQQEFLSVIKRLVALPFNIVLISQEDTSRDITRRAGEKITAVAPAIREKVARKVSGMVDIVLRVVNDEGHRVLQNKPSDIVFGGGRLAIKAGDYPCTMESINEMYNHITVETEEK